MANKVYTTIYSDFKGVDYTNDASNVWKRRSPTGYNMLPDESGRPFKRTGWEIMFTNQQILDDLNSINNSGFDECTIMKLAWFELAGQDHLVIFTNRGVLFYNSDGLKDGSLDADCFTGFDRCFFFEGNGKSAFYIYGNFRMWQYDSSFTLTEITSQLYVPTVLIGASALCVGTTYEGYNLLYNQAAVQYDDYDLFTYWCSDGIKVSVDKTTFTAGKTKGNPASYKYTYTSGAWSPSLASGITVTGTPKEGDSLIVIWCNGVLFPNNVNANDSQHIRVYATKGGAQFGVELTYESDDNNPCSATNHVNIHADHIKRKDQQAWAEFYRSDTFTGVTGEDLIRVVIPTNYVEQTPVATETYTEQTQLNGEVV